MINFLLVTVVAKLIIAFISFYVKDTKLIVAALVTNESPW